MKRFIACVLICALLAACSTYPNGDLDGRDCAPSSNSGSVNSGNPLADLAAILIVDLVWFGGCEAVVGIVNGVRHFHPAQPRGGVYYSPDGVFSVGVPLGLSDEYQAQQRTAVGRDMVVFVSRTPGMPVYGVTVLTKLEESQADLSLQELSQRTSAGLLGAGVVVTPIYTEDVQLSANPARLAVYRAQAPADGSAEPDYYLMYFVKTQLTAAILSIRWPYECPRCATGPNSALRDMDPTLHAFLDSFELASKTP